MDNNKKRVVIVDDEEDVVIYLTALLSDNGYHVESAIDGRQGLKLVKERKPHLICLDILMPGETGFSLYKKIKRDPALKEIPVIIISGMDYGEEGKEKDSLNTIQPPDSYMEKPVKPDQFIERVRSVIG